MGRIAIAVILLLLVVIAIVHGCYSSLAVRPEQDEVRMGFDRRARREGDKDRNIESPGVLARESVRGEHDARCCRLEEVE